MRLLGDSGTLCKRRLRLSNHFLASVLAKFEATKRRTPKKGRLLKRDAVIFAAILLGHQGTKYCAFLHEREIRPKWCDPESRTESYPKRYKAGDPWRKKVQDEKTRAKLRMDRYTDSELSTAFHSYLPDRLDTLRHKLSIRDSLRESVATNLDSHSAVLGVRMTYES